MTIDTVKRRPSPRPRRRTRTDLEPARQATPPAAPTRYPLRRVTTAAASLTLALAVTAAAAVDVDATTRIVWPLIAATLAALTTTTAAALTTLATGQATR